MQRYFLQKNICADNKWIIVNFIWECYSHVDMEFL